MGIRPRLWPKCNENLRRDHLKSIKIYWSILNIKIYMQFILFDLLRNPATAGHLIGGDIWRLSSARHFWNNRLTHGRTDRQTGWHFIHSFWSGQYRSDCLFDRYVCRSQTTKITNNPSDWLAAGMDDVSCLVFRVLFIIKFQLQYMSHRAQWVEDVQNNQAKNRILFKLYIVVKICSCMVHLHSGGI